VSVNCAAIPDALLESELFGHEKGAFTGPVARRDRQVRGGAWRHASPRRDLRDGRAASGEALRALQERVIDRVGGSQPVKVDIRVIATSTACWRRRSQGTFREDLLFRLNVVHLRIPAAPGAPGDVLELASFFLKALRRRERACPPARCQLDARSAWCQRPGGGNVRELENTMHRAVSPGGADDRAEDHPVA
jgi:transcriptional regulator with GAF, ATPase, and Fis domain